MQQINAVMQYLGVAPAAPDRALLDTLISAYVRAVPWESVSRIAARFAGVGTYPRWPETFWEQAITQGTGGTCFESNYAFFTLLRHLGYEGYLTINNMGTMTGCHTAIVIQLDGERWLVDAGLPVYVPLRLDTAPTQRDGVLQRYTVRPLEDDCYDIEREPHPSLNAFTLIDRPVDEAAYRAAAAADYESGGLFLDRAIINKVIDGDLWRFASSDTPYRIETFDTQTGGTRGDHYISGDAAGRLAQHFGMDEGLIRAALAVVERAK